jgi:hypothetical protein
MEVKLNLSSEEHKELVSYCNLNDLLISSVVKDSFKTGFNIERYGLLNVNQATQEKIVEKEVIKYVEVPKEIEKEVIRIEYVEVEKPVEKIVEIIKEVPAPPTEVKVVEYVDREVIKEVPVEKVVEKIVNIYDNSQINELLDKIKELESKPPRMVEVIKEVPVEKIVEKQVGITDNSKLEALQNTLAKIRKDNIEKDLKIKELEKTIEQIQNLNEDKKAVFLSGSNLENKLYK